MITACTYRILEKTLLLLSVSLEMPGPRTGTSKDMLWVSGNGLNRNTHGYSHMCSIGSLQASQTNGVALYILGNLEILIFFENKQQKRKQCIGT